jgi:hypothetical protein
MVACVKARQLTVRDLERKLTPNEVRRAKIAKKLMRNMDLRTSKLMIMLRKNGIKRAEINAMDVSRCVEIYDRGVGYLKGHETAHTSMPRVWESLVDLVPADRLLEIDIMFLNDKTMYLVGLARPTIYCTLKELQSKGQYHIWSQLSSMIAEIEATGEQVRLCCGPTCVNAVAMRTGPELKYVRTHTTRLIRCDGESAMGSTYMQERMASRGIQLDVAMGKTKVSGVERLIRTLRDDARSIVAGQLYQFDDTLERWLMQSVRFWYNSQPVNAATDGKSPREKLYRRTVDAVKDARHAFGDYVQVPVRKTTNGIHEDRTIGALALCPVGSM